MNQDDSADEGPSLVSNRIVEIIVALLFLLGSAIVVIDSVRLGFGWIEGEGPAPGYFPFYIAVFMAVASLATLIQAITGKIKDGGESFVSVIGFGRVLSVLVPTLLYVMLIGGLKVGPVAIPGLGLYVASGIFIALFMVVFGKDNPLKALAVGAAVPFVLFLMFEKWFLVPLPKGPLEAMFGF